MPNLKWDQLTHLQVGQYAEYYVKMEFTSYGFDVFTSEVDDKGIDFVVKSNSGRFYEVQVKALRKAGYIFAKKEKFDINNEGLIMAIVIFKNEVSPEVYLIPAKKWKDENPLLRNRNYCDKKSQPEWGVNVSAKNYRLLKEYSFEKMIEKL